MGIVTDFHSHILPEMDDGSGSVRESLEMLRREARQGVKQIIATPHFYARYDNPDNFLRRREETFGSLRRAMEGETGLPQVKLGAEVHYFPGMSDSEVLSRLTIGDGRCILIEMPSAPWTDRMYRELEWIYVRRGLVPVIAHVDRYIGPLRTFRIPERLAQLPVLVQANAEFFLSRRTASFALRLLREDQIHVLGSDCHNLTDRAPNLGAAAEVIRQRLGDGTLERIRQHELEILTVL